MVRYFERGDYSELKLNILERWPTRAERIADAVARVENLDLSALGIDPARPPSEYCHIARALRRAGRKDDAAALLEQLIAVNEGGERAPPAAWRDLAVNYRQRKDDVAEVALLERFAAGPVPRGRAGEELLARLDKARERAAKGR